MRTLFNRNKPVNRQVVNCRFDHMINLAYFLSSHPGFLVFSQADTNFAQRGAKLIGEFLDAPGFVFNSSDIYLGKSIRVAGIRICLLYTSPSPRDRTRARMPSSA